MNVEEFRLNTFREWPANAPVDPTRLARAGFFYTGFAQEVQCFLCGTKISTWNFSESAMSRHRQAAPDCPFVSNPAATCNVPSVPAPANTASASSCTEAMQLNNVAEGHHSTPLNPSKNPRVEYGTFAQRLRSFKNWPIPDVVSPHDLAKAGFYYLQSGDLVQCVYCKAFILKWEPGDDPDKEHRTNFPNCDFYMHQDESDQLELNNVKLMPGTEPDLSKLGILVCTPPRKPEYSTYEQRLSTFHNWCREAKQTKEALATAGFYYEGFEDHVRCFHCDGGLRNWEETDDAWVEHARWFPKCEYVALIRGQEFIRQCIENRKPLDPSIFEGVPEDENVDVTESPVASPSTVSPPVQETSLDVRHGERSVPGDSARSIRKADVPTVGAGDASGSSLQEECAGSSTRNQIDSQRTDVVTLLNKLSMVERNHDPLTQCNAVEGNGLDSVASENKIPPLSNGDEVKAEIFETDDKRERNTLTDKALDIASLEEQNRRLREARLCKICMHMEVAIVLLPCGHLSTCIYCTSILTHCPMCRQQIRATVRAFFS